MYNVNTIRAEFISLVGWRQNQDPEGWQLTSMLTSQSGLWFNGVHPALTIENLQSICPRFDQYDGNPSQATINANFTNWIKNRTEDGIIKALDYWLRIKVLENTANNLLARKLLFESSGSPYDYDTNSSKIVGVEISPTRGRSIKTQLHRIGLQFETAQNIEINLFKNSDPNPVKSETLEYTAAGAVQWFDLTDWILDPSGSYYVAYDQAQISGRSINGTYDHNHTRQGLQNYPGRRYYAATFFSAPAGATLSQLWDISKNDYIDLGTNYGLNIDVSVVCDYTDFIVSQKDRFKDIISLQVGMDLLREIAFNPSSRVNRNESNYTRSQLLFEIDGDSQGRSDFALIGKFKESINSIKFDTTNIERVCLPCKRRATRFKTIS